MKALRLFTIVLFVSCFIIANDFAQNGPSASTTTVDEIFGKINTTKVFKVFGFEVIAHSGTRNSLAVSPALITALTQLDTPALSRIIAEQTDYECLIGKDYFLIVPKDDPTKHDLATSKREIQINAIDNASYQEILDQINKNNPIKSHRPLIAGPAFEDSTVKKGSISLKAGQYKCYDLLNEMAIQLKSPSWRIDHLPTSDAYPIILDPGLVTFDYY